MRSSSSCVRQVPQPLQRIAAACISATPHCSCSGTRTAAAEAAATLPLVDSSPGRFSNGCFNREGTGELASAGRKFLIVRCGSSLMSCRDSADDRDQRSP